MILQWQSALGYTKAGPTVLIHAAGKQHPGVCNQVPEQRNGDYSPKAPERLGNISHFELDFSSMDVCA